MFRGKGLWETFGFKVRALPALLGKLPKLRGAKQCRQQNLCLKVLAQMVLHKLVASAKGSI